MRSLCHGRFLSTPPFLLCIIAITSLSILLVRCAMTGSTTSQFASKLGSIIGLRDRPASKFHVAPEEHFVHQVQGTYPRLCRLSDGSILAGYTAFAPDGERILSVARSLDEGKTFRPHGEVTRSRGDCDNLFLLELPPARSPGGGGHTNTNTNTDSITGTVLAAFRNHDLDPSGEHAYFRITVCRSTDGGRSWEVLAQAAEKPAPLGLWEPFLRLGPGSDGDGQEDIQLFFSQELAPDDQDTMLVRSADGGRSWTAPAQRVSGAGERLRDGMVGVAKTRDRGDRRGRGESEPEPEPDPVEKQVAIMVMETTRTGRYSVEAAVSYDGGNSFSGRQVVYEARRGRNAGAPQIASFADGSLAVVFMTDEDSAAEPRWPGGAAVKAVFSGPPEDGKLRWTEPVLVGEAESSWPGIMRVADDAVLAVYEHSSYIRGRMLRLAS